MPDRPWLLLFVVLFVVPLVVGVWLDRPRCMDAALPLYGAEPARCTHPDQRLASSDGVALCLCPRDASGRQR